MSYQPRQLTSLLRQIDEDELLLPQMQRPFVWDVAQISRLFDSLMRQYPIQTFLFWVTPDDVSARKFMKVSAPIPNLADLSACTADRHRKTLVLDGQQRLQALYILFFGALSSAYKIPDDLLFQDEKPDIARNQKDLFAVFDFYSDGSKDNGGYKLKFSAKDPLFPYVKLTDFMLDYAKRPERLDDVYILNDLRNRRSAYGLNSTEENERALSSNLRRVLTILTASDIFYCSELRSEDRNWSLSKVVEVFVRINSGGTHLDAMDLAISLISGRIKDLASGLDKVCKEVLTDCGFDFDRDFLFSCLLQFNGRDGFTDLPETVELLSDQNNKNAQEFLERLERGWEDFEIACGDLRDFIREILKFDSRAEVKSKYSLLPILSWFYFNDISELDRNARDVVYRDMRRFYYNCELIEWYKISEKWIRRSIVLTQRNPNNSISFPFLEIREAVCGGDPGFQREFDFDEFSNLPRKDKAIVHWMYHVNVLNEAPDKDTYTVSSKAAPRPLTDLKKLKEEGLRHLLGSTEAMTFLPIQYKDGFVIEPKKGRKGRTKGDPVGETALIRSC